MFAGAEELITTNKDLFSIKNSTSKKDEAALTLNGRLGPSRGASASGSNKKPKTYGIRRNALLPT